MRAELACGMMESESVREVILVGRIGDAVRRTILSWPEVTEAQHRFGGVEFRFHGTELGHLHGDRLADLPFPRRIRDELVASGRAAPHHVLPDSGWVSYRIKGPEDVPAVLALFRLQYDRLSARWTRAVQHSEQTRTATGGTP